MTPIPRVSTSAADYVFTPAGDCYFIARRDRDCQHILPTYHPAGRITPTPDTPQVDAEPDHLAETISDSVGSLADYIFKQMGAT